MGTHHTTSACQTERNSGFLIRTWHIHGLAAGRASTQNAAPGAKTPRFRTQNAKGPQRRGSQVLGI